MQRYHQRLKKSDIERFENTLSDHCEQSFKLTFDLKDGYEVDITAVPPEEDEDYGYVDAVLFLNGVQADQMDPGHTLAGAYWFSIEPGKKICLTLE